MSIKCYYLGTKQKENIMVSLNPLHLVQTGVSCALSATYNKMKEGIKAHATKKNIAIVTTGAIGVGALMIHPVTRLALCTLLGLTVTMTTIFLNLALVALSLVLLALQGVKSTVETGVSSAPGLFDTIKSIFGRKNSDSVQERKKLLSEFETSATQSIPSGHSCKEMHALYNAESSAGEDYIKRGVLEEAFRSVDPDNEEGSSLTAGELSKLFDEYQNEQISFDVTDLSESYDQFEKRQETVQENANLFIKTINELSPDSKERVAKRMQMLLTQLVSPSKL